METVQPKGLLPEQWRLFYHMFLTMLVAATVAGLLHKPFLLFIIPFISWTVSIFTYRVTGYLAITRGVLGMGIIAYLLYRFVFPDVP